jgi:hypothetical protein
LTGGAPDPAGSPIRGVPLLVVAELPREVFAWADALRRRHYPAERNRLGAHVTLFHGLPPSAQDEVLTLLGDLSRLPPPAASISGLIDLGGGTAFAVESPAMAALHAEMAERLHGLIQQKDARPLRLHITVQNKVAAADARALQAELSRTSCRRDFRFRGFGLYGWTGDLWQQARIFPFRGSEVKQES